MEKTIICDYWKNNICKHMKDSFKCKFAHGVEEIQTINCMYGINCYNINCKFKHEDKTTIPVMVYDIPIVDKRKNKKNKNKNKKQPNHDVKKKNDFYLHTEISVEDKYKINNTGTDIVTIIKKDEDIKEKVNVKNPDDKKLLPFLDEYYKDIINKKNKFINEIVTYNYKYIVNIRKENDLLKSQNNELKTKNIKLELDKLEREKENNILKNTCATKMGNSVNKLIINKNKLLKLYNKYVNLYNIFKNSKDNYKSIDIEEINKYTKDKNIYKIKQRAYKIYNFYEKYKNGLIKDLLPISRIITMVF